MIPVAQTNTNGKGNCMAAALASILEIETDEVPDYRAIDAAGGSWLNAINTWLSKHFGQLYIELEPEVTDVVQPLGWHLANYGSRKSGHSVVAFAGRVVWDPRGAIAPDVGAARPYSYGVLVELSEELKGTWVETWQECLCPACVRGES